MKRKYEQSNTIDENKDETSLWFFEILTRKDKLKALASIIYEPSVDVFEKHKKVLRALFLQMDGFVWVHRFGWIGQSKTPARDEIEPFEISAGLYDGIKIEKIEEVDYSGERKFLFVPVKSIQFDNNGARGSLPSYLGHLNELEIFTASFNLIDGTIPLSLEALTVVKMIDLSANLLSGGLNETMLSKLTSLITLNLSYNELSGSIPDVFASLVLLEKLDLSSNFFTGCLPPSIGCLNRLQELKVANNALEGDIPSTFSSLSILRTLNLSQNRLTGGLDALMACSRLERLMMQHNQLKGTLTPSIGQWKRLRLLYLHANELEGELPDELCLLGRLELLNLSSNKFRGCIPDRIGQLKNLESLLLHENYLIGPVPLSIKNLVKLRDFYVFKPYPAEFSMPDRKFSRVYFERVHVMGPSMGIDSIHWDFATLYRRNKQPSDNLPFTLFSGKL
eukprot:scaffold6421_cov251-Ochromonas_danica.AAC.1